MKGVFIIKYYNLPKQSQLIIATRNDQTDQFKRWVGAQRSYKKKKGERWFAPVQRLASLQNRQKISFFLNRKVLTHLMACSLDLAPSNFYYLWFYGPASSVVYAAIEDVGKFIDNFIESKLLYFSAMETVVQESELKLKKIIENILIIKSFSLKSRNLSTKHFYVAIEIFNQNFVSL